MQVYYGDIKSSIKGILKTRILFISLGKTKLGFYTWPEVQTSGKKRCYFAHEKKCNPQQTLLVNQFALFLQVVSSLHMFFLHTQIKTGHVWKQSAPQARQPLSFPPRRTITTNNAPTDNGSLRDLKNRGKIVHYHHYQL